MYISYFFIIIMHCSKFYWCCNLTLNWGMRENVMLFCNLEVMLLNWPFSSPRAITIQKIDFLPKISKFLGPKGTFSPLAANWSLTDQCFQHKKGVSLESRYEGTNIFTPCPQKIGFWAQKRPNLAQNWHFGPNIGIFGPFDLKPDQKTMPTSCLGSFLLCWYQNFHLLP